LFFCSSKLKLHGTKKFGNTVRKLYKYCIGKPPEALEAQVILAEDQVNRNKA
jgi:hypothetical protein